MTGSRRNGMGRVTCSGGGCDAIFAGWQQAHERLVQVGHFDAAKKLYRYFVPVPKVIACSVPTYIAPGQEGNPKETTSHSSDEARLIAAIDVVMNTFGVGRGGNRVGLDGEYQIVFSDGGTQTLIYRPGNPTGASKFSEPSDLEKGDGVSKCE